MSMWGEVVESLQTMTVWQLLLAFIACTGYALAHGRLVGTRAKCAAVGLAALAVLGFVLQAERWVDGVMLVAVGIATMGLFVATVWLVCRALGMTAAVTPRPIDSHLTVPPTDADTAGRGLAAPRHPAPSH